MRISHYQSGETQQPRLPAQARETFGRIAARRPVTPSPVLAPTARLATHSVPAPLSPRLEAAARAHRTLGIGDLVAAAWHGGAARARRLVAAWRRQRERRATYLALRGLDDRALKDLGFSRSEILSVAMDLDRDDEPRRLRTTRRANDLRPF